jgi:hypothetical protein
MHKIMIYGAKPHGMEGIYMYAKDHMTALNVLQPRPLLYRTIDLLPSPRYSQATKSFNLPCQPIFE